MYLLYNEFKSVIAQRLVVEHLLPIKEIGVVDVRLAEEAEEEERKRAIEAAKSAGVGVRAPETREIDAKAAEFGTAQVDYIYEQPAEDMFNAAAAQVHEHTDFPCAAGIRRRRTRGAYDRDGSGDQQCDRHDRIADAGDEPGAAGEDHERNY